MPNCCPRLLSTLADRRSPVGLLRLGLVGQLGGLGLATVTALTDGPAGCVYGGAIVAATMVGTVRPALSLVVPGVARSAAELGTANAVTGWLESVGAMAAGLVVGGLVGRGGPGWVFAAGSVLVVGSLLATAGLRVARVDVDAGGGAAVALGEVARLVRCSPRPRVLVLVVTAGWVVVGALDVLFVVLAVDVLHRGTAWTGYLTTAFGVGGVLAVGVTVVVVGRRLGGPVVVASLVVVGALLALAVHPGPLVTLAVVVVLGAARSVLEVTATTLLQRIVPSTLTGRVFGVVEGLSMAGMAAGALLVPAAATVGGPDAALPALAAVVVLGLLGGGRLLRRLDGGSGEPLVEIALLRQVPRYADLPVAALTALAATSTRVDVARGEPVATGAPYAIAGGVVDIVAAGGATRTRGRGDALDADPGAGTTVFARTPLTLYRLDEDVVSLTRAGRPPAGP